MFASFRLLYEAIGRAKEAGRGTGGKYEQLHTFPLPVSAQIKVLRVGQCREIKLDVIASGAKQSLFSFERRGFLISPDEKFYLLVSLALFSSKKRQKAIALPNPSITCLHHLFYIDPNRSAKYCRQLSASNFLSRRRTPSCMARR